MTKFVGGPGDDGNTFSSLGAFASLPVLTHTSSQVVFDNNSVHIAFKGSGFGGFDPNGIPSTGTITSIVGQVVSGPYTGTNDLAMSKFSLDFATAWNFILSDDAAGFQAALFSGNDTFITHNQPGDHAAVNGETLLGLGGKDTFDAHDSGGGEILDGGTGADTFEFGAALTASDRIDGGADADKLILDGDYSGGLSFASTTMVNVEQLVLAAGNSYDLTLNDANVGAGQALAVNAAKLGSGDSLHFDGSAETDGKFKITGGDGPDTLIGGAGADKIQGGLWGDHLTGGAGKDVFIYGSYSESLGSANAGPAGSGFDTISDFDAKADKIDLWMTVAAIDTPVSGGAVHTALFDTDMTALVTSGQLGVHHAVLFTSNGGDYNGHTFLIVDANGTAGYQAGDFVLDVTGGTHLASLSLSDFI